MIRRASKGSVRESQSILESLEFTMQPHSSLVWQNFALLAGRHCPATTRAASLFTCSMHVTSCATAEMHFLF